MAETVLHGSCVAVGEVGVLILGPPGAGKSSLVLRLIDQPGRGTSGIVRSAELVADDQVVIRREGHDLIASAPKALAGKLEVRGLGIVDVRARPEAAIGLVIRLTPAGNVERLPEPEDSRVDILGVVRPLLLIDASHASAPSRVRAALDSFRLGD